MTQLMTKAEYARRIGKSKTAIRNWELHGYVKMVDGKVDVQASDDYLAKYHPEGRPETKLGIEVASKDGESPKDAAQRIVASGGATMSIDEARRVKENYLALLNQLEYDIKVRKVVLFEDALKSVGEQYARVRTRLLAIPSEQAPRVHRLKTVAEVQDCLLEIITEALEELTKDGGISK